jgi:hypothetical protein
LKYNREFTVDCRWFQIALEQKGINNNNMPFNVACTQGFYVLSCRWWKTFSWGSFMKITSAETFSRTTQSFCAGFMAKVVMEFSLFLSALLASSKKISTSVNTGT